MRDEAISFVDTIDEMPFLDEEFNFDAAVADVEDRGFVPWPDYVPLPLLGYEYAFPGMIEPYLKPACRLRHRIRYWMRYWWSAIMRPIRELDSFDKIFGKKLPDDGIPF